MLHPPKCATALVIPVLNENGRILEQLQRIQVYSANVDVIVADGGSTDGSLDIDNLERLGVTALLTKQDIGKLSAQLRMAFSFCLEQGYESVITMDGNNKDGVEGIERLNHALNNGFDFVQGSRFVKGGDAGGAVHLGLEAVVFLDVLQERDRLGEEVERIDDEDPDLLARVIGIRALEVT